MGVTAAMFMLLGSCADPQSSGQMPLKLGASSSEVLKAGVKATVRFSYVIGGAKYDLVSLEGSPNPVLFKNSRLLIVLPPDALPEFDRWVNEHLKSVDLPFEKGVSELHAWILAQGKVVPKPAASSDFTAGDAGNAVASAVILVPISPVLFAGGVCAAAEHAMTGKERTRAELVNQALLASGPSYARFLGQFKRFDFNTAKGSYQIREYLATDGAFFTGRDFFYEVGFRDGKPVWVAYENNAVRFDAVAYWRSHR